MALDDALEQIKRGITDDDGVPLDGLVHAGGMFSPIVAVYGACKAAFDADDMKHRMTTAIRALCDELSTMRDKLPTDAEQVLALKWFREAVCVVLEDARAAVDEDHATMLAVVAAHGCFPDAANTHRRDELPLYLRDLAQLGINDVEMLKMICEAQRDAVKNAPNLNDVNIWSNGYGTLKRMTDRKGMHPDDCISRGKRLEGFGLAVYTENSGVVHQDEVRFRPTLRGLYLVSLLTEAESSMAVRRDAQNGGKSL